MTPEEEKCEFCEGTKIWGIADDGSKIPCICVPTKNELRIIELEKQLSDAVELLKDIKPHLVIGDIAHLHMKIDDILLPHDKIKDNDSL